MCTSCNTTFTIFTVEIAANEPVNTDTELYKEMAHRLFQSKVISSLKVNNNNAYTVNDRHLFGFDLHLANTHNALTVTLENVENALNGILDKFENYYDMKIKHK